VLGYGLRMYSTAGLPLARTLPQPPRLHWGLVLLFDVLTLGIFDPIWLIVQADWVRKVRGRSRAMPWIIAYMVLMLLFVSVTVGAIFLGLAAPAMPDRADSITTLFRVVTLILRILAIYVLRNELMESPIRISTSGLITYFLGAMYFQYCLRDYVITGEDRPPADGTLGFS
jgi:hypothetical protein